MNIKVLIAGMSLLIAMFLSCGLKIRGAQADDRTTAIMCQDVGIAMEAIDDYRDALVKEVQRYEDRDDRVAQVRRGVLIPLIEDLKFMENFVLRFEHENCAVH